jgi:hypothetical protein
MSVPIIVSARLVDGTDELPLTRTDGIYLQSLDLGFPAVREVSEDRTQQDGADDRTEHFGARAVTVTVRVMDAGAVTSGGVLDRLAAFLRPSRRPWLVYTLAGQDERRIRLRADQRSAPLGLPLRVLADVQVGWKAPDGVSFSTDTRDASVSPGGGEIGRTYPLVYNRTRVYPAGGGLGTVRMEVGGTAPAQPISRLYGPFGGAGKRTGWANESTGERLEFDGLQVAAGDYVELDHRERTVRLNGNTDAASNRYRFLDFAVSTWWALEPGQDNTLRFYPDVWNAPAQARIEAEDTWL